MAGFLICQNAYQLPSVSIGSHELEIRIFIITGDIIVTIIRSMD